MLERLAEIESFPSEKLTLELQELEEALESFAKEGKLFHIVTGMMFYYEQLRINGINLTEDVSIGFFNLGMRLVNIIKERYFRGNRREEHRFTASLDISCFNPRLAERTRFDTLLFTKVRAEIIHLKREKLPEEKILSANEQIIFRLVSPLRLSSVKQDALTLTRSLKGKPKVTVEVDFT